MKEKNVFNQLKLVKAQRYWREKQIESIEGAYCSFTPDRSPKESKIYEHVAVFLAFIARFLENTVAKDLEVAEQRLNQLHTLVGEGQVDYCLSSALGVCEGANIIGLVSSELVSEAQRALGHSTALTLGHSNRLGLPLFANDLGEDLAVACMDTNDTAIAEYGRRTKHCLELATDYNLDAQNVYEFLTPSISSYVNATTMTTAAGAFLLAAQLSSQAFSATGVFDKDPSAHVQEKEVQIARFIAAGIAADIMTGFVRRGNTWDLQSLN